MENKGKEGTLRWLASRIRFLIPLFVFITSAAIAGLAFMLPSVLTSRAFVDGHLYLFGTFAQLLMDLPAASLLLRSRWDWLGGKRERRMSFAVGLVGAIFIAAVRLALNGHLHFMEQVPAFGQSLLLPSPANILAGALTILAHGPGEALIQVYLVLAFDDALEQHQRVLSIGVIANATLWGLGHIAAVIVYGWSAVRNALLMLLVGTLTGVMFKKTRSALGPMIFWTLVNGTSA